MFSLTPQWDVAPLHPGVHPYIFIPNTHLPLFFSHPQLSQALVVNVVPRGTPAHAADLGFFQAGNFTLVFYLCIFLNC